MTIACIYFQIRSSFLIKSLKSLKKTYLFIKITFQEFYQEYTRYVYFSSIWKCHLNISSFTKSIVFLSFTKLVTNSRYSSYADV